MPSLPWLWLGAEIAAAVTSFFFRHTHLAGETVVFAHERMTLFTASRPRRGGAELPNGYGS